MTAGIVSAVDRIVSDVPMVQTITVVLAILIIFFNLVADVLLGMFDPRIRYD